MCECVRVSAQMVHARMSAMFESTLQDNSATLCLDHLHLLQLEFLPFAPSLALNMKPETKTLNPKPEICICFSSSCCNSHASFSFFCYLHPLQLVPFACLLQFALVLRICVCVRVSVHVCVCLCVSARSHGSTKSPVASTKKSFG